ncbi:molybdenum cofactor guanylyltransferase MobA [Rubellimicrobium arenae]|uniref:molybdenum cofactor guanylyltransferase MobA n=1 Tax=Rubellimicrobium arenae TaxID=2817372 RepID=UPI0034A0EF45
MSLVPIPAVIVAGGLARRMGGGDKMLRPLGTGTILSEILRRLGPQASPVAINANGDPARFAAFGLIVLPDPVEGRPGPLAGLLAAMEWAERLGAREVLSVPGDAPFLPPDLLPRLRQAGAPAIASSGGRDHPVAGLWPSALGAQLRDDLSGGLRRVLDFADRQGARRVVFDLGAGGPDPFLNINTPEDLTKAASWL